MSINIKAIVQQCNNCDGPDVSDPKVVINNSIKLRVRKALSRHRGLNIDPLSNYLTDLLYSKEMHGQEINHKEVFDNILCTLDIVPLGSEMSTLLRMVTTGFNYGDVQKKLAPGMCDGAPS